MDNFEGLTAVVTGSASGIGRALAVKAASEGMNVCIADMNSSALEILADELKAKGVNVYAQKLDVSSSESVKSFAAECFSRFNTVELLFNNAGILSLGCAWEQSVEDWERLLSINVMGVVNGINAFLPAMVEAEKAAHIVNTGSVGSLVAAAGMAQYTASKMAVRGITECLSVELQLQQAPIGVSLLCPGPVATNIAEGVITRALGDDASAEMIAEAKAATVAGDPNFITPDVCAELVFSAIRDNKFWIFTHPFNRYYKGLTDAVLNGENPSYSDVEFD
ncbi:SDR family NAD(P)-dependent oxidoreductase [Zhongshania aquimaris]|uniref:SDR family NAD(P)-dependent oxidoreductase n=1 Tax=Zhongshania aquimaris TaxID=2857107 RepID=A0ABS6VSN1_9GAMM|nr:SDR family NAD(P)-dependent oxidoreductase [Zhongshania aquimaris]